MDVQNPHRDQEKQLKGEKPPLAVAAAPPPPPPPPLPPPPPPPSSATSPSHEFSFTITLDPPPFSSSSPIHSLKSCSNRKTTTTTSAPSFDVDYDLAPAENIFFHGHLPPLRSAAGTTDIPPSDTDISIESFRVPLDHIGSDRSLMYPADHDHHHQGEYHSRKVTSENKESSKARSFSSFFGLVKPRRSGDSGDKDQDERRKKKKKVFDMGRFLKKYVSMMEMLSFFKAGNDKQKRDLRRRPYSFSGHSSRAKSEKDSGWRRKKGQFSAPASLKTSPTNCGLLLTTPMTFSRSVDNSTMEELQSAIQAAIAHCKNSTTMEEKCK